MTEVCLLPIVEGHGEARAARLLVDRIWYELLGGTGLQVVKPWRMSRSKLVRPSGEVHETELARILELGLRRCRAKCQTEDQAFVLLLDADRDLPCELAPRLLEAARRVTSGLDVCCVLANPEIETWLVAGAESLGDFLDLSGALPRDPEGARCKKKWIEERFLAPTYAPTRHLARMFQIIDLELVRRRSPSFDKLVRELEKRLP